MLELDGEPSYEVQGLQECQDMLVTGSPSPGTSIQELHCSRIKCMYYGYTPYLMPHNYLKKKLQEELMTHTFL
jgi:hypothetical protein